MRLVFQVAPPSVERVNQIRVLHVELGDCPGSAAGEWQFCAPLRSVQAA
jgi:hypothetical protein